MRRPHLDNRDVVRKLNDRLIEYSRVYKDARARVRYHINQVREWDQIMSRRTYRIELKIDFSDDDRHATMEELVRQYGRDLLASAMLVQDGRKPLVALFIDDSFVGTDEIALLPASDSIHVPDEVTP